MPFTSRVYRVLIASPSDLKEERYAATQAVNDWNALHSAEESVTLQPVLWETHAFPQMGERPQAVINRQLVGDCDILVAMFWTTVGTKTECAESGTVEEMNQFTAAGKPALVYFSSRDLPADVDPAELDRLRRFKERTQTKGITGSFRDLDDLCHTLLRDLTRQVRELKTSDVEWHGGKMDEAFRIDPKAAATHVVQPGDRELGSGGAIYPQELPDLAPTLFD
jgi:nucleoside 2-deoxyribosyltransferase